MRKKKLYTKIWRKLLCHLSQHEFELKNIKRLPEFNNPDPIPEAMRIECACSRCGEVLQAFCGLSLRGRIIKND